MKLLLLFLGFFLVECSGHRVTDAADRGASGMAKDSLPQAVASVPSNAKNEQAIPNAPKPAPGAFESLSCTLSSDTRVLEIIPKSPGCELKYTKFSETKSSASSAIGPAHCESVRDQIRANLEKSGYVCR